jgi:hypothetical protein
MPDPEPIPDDDELSAPATPSGTDDKAVTTTDGAASSPVALKCNTAFRRAMLAKLPVLGYTSWNVKESIRLDDEWAAIVSINADSVLEPLESVVATLQPANLPPRSAGQ